MTPAYWGYQDNGFNLLGRFNLHKGLEYYLGYDFQSYKGSDEVLLIAEDSEHVHAFFGQVRTTEDMLENTKLAAGLRHNIAKGGDTTTIWNVSGQHNFSDRFYVRGVTGTAFRLPTAYELYAIDDCCTLGNPNLVGEESFNVNVAVGGKSEFASSTLAWEAISFYREVDNLISGQDVGGAQRVFMNTENTVKMKGFELILNYRIGDLSAMIDFTWSDAKEEGSGDQITGIPVHAIKAGLNYDPEGLPFGLGLTANYVGDIYDTANSERIEHGNYVILDLNGYYFIDDDRKHRIGLRLENMLDKDYASSLGTASYDDGSGSYAYENLGTPRTLHVDYSYQF